jgi:hypothetical protein
MSNLLSANVDIAFPLFGQLGFSDPIEVRRSNLRVLTNVIQSDAPLTGISNYGAEDCYEQLVDVRYHFLRLFWLGSLTNQFISFFARAT